MSKVSKEKGEAWSRGFSDGYKYEKRGDQGIIGVLSELFGPSSYRGDSKNPNDYRAGFEAGKGAAKTLKK